MKQHVILILTIVISSCVASCSFFGEKNKADEQKMVETIVMLPDSVKEKMIAQDSLMKALIVNIDTLANKLSVLKSENAQLKEAVSNLESPKSVWNYLTMAALMLAIIALIFSIVNARKRLKSDRVKQLCREYLGESTRFSDLKEKVDKLENVCGKGATGKAKPSDEQNGLEKRVGKLESVVKQVVDYINKNHAAQKTTSSPHPTGSLQKTGYAKAEKDVFFTTIYDSCHEGCVYEIKFSDDSHGKFSIISLDKIKSRNDWQMMVECSGVSIKEATGFNIVEMGQCKRIDATTWKVTNKLKIKLQK